MRNVNDAKGRRNKVFNAKYDLHKNADAVQQMFGIEVPKDILNMKNEIFYEYIIETVYPRIVEVLNIPKDVLANDEKFIKYYNDVLWKEQGPGIANVVLETRECVRDYRSLYKKQVVINTSVIAEIMRSTDKFDTPEK